MLALVAAAVVWLVRTAPAATAALVVLPGLLPFLALAVPDLLLGGRRSQVPRYLAPAWLTLQLAVSGFLAEQGAASGTVRDALEVGDRRARRRGCA